MKRLLPLLVDQGFSSAGAFLFSVILARSVGLQDYSLYAQAISVSVIVAAVFQTAYLEPRQLNRVESTTQTAYLFDDLKIIGFIALIVFLITWPAGGIKVAAVVTLFVGGSVFLFGCRRYLAFRNQSRTLSSLSFLYFVAALGSSILLALTDQGALTWLATHGILSILLTLLVQKEIFVQKSGTLSSWDFGIDPTSLLIAFVAWLQTNFFYFYLPYLDLQRESGQLRAIFNLLMPAMQFLTVLNIKYIGSIGQQSESGASAQKLLLIVFAFCLFYAVALSLVGEPLFHFLYKEPIQQDASKIAGWMLLAMSLSGASSIVLRAVKRSRIVVGGHLAGLVIVIPFIFFWNQLDVNNALLIIAISYSVTSTVFLVGLPRERNAH